MKTKPKLPKTINLTITEADRQNADYYMSNCNCLVATALRRRGFKDVMECAVSSRIEGVLYRHATLTESSLHFDRTAFQKPLYLPSVVGLKIKLTRAK